MWRAAFSLSWLVLLLSVVMFCVWIALFPSLMEEFGQLSLLVWAVICAIMILLVFFMARLGYGLGVRIAMKHLPGPTA